MTNQELEVSRAIYQSQERKIAALTAELERVRGERDSFEEQAQSAYKIFKREVTTLEVKCEDLRTKLTAAEAERDNHKLLRKLYFGMVNQLDQNRRDLEQERDALREQVARLVTALNGAIGIAFHTASCKYDGNDPKLCDCGIQAAREAIDTALAETKEPIKK